MKPTWILVANQTRGRIYKTHPSYDELREVIDFVNLDGRAHETDLTTDRPGRDAPRGGSPHRHGNDPGDTKKMRSARDHARKISEYLDDARSQGRFSKLHVIAAPAFLGMLRNAFSDPMSRIVAEEVDKDIVDANADTIRRAIA